MGRISVREELRNIKWELWNDTLSKSKLWNVKMNIVFSRSATKKRHNYKASRRNKMRH